MAFFTPQVLEPRASRTRLRGSATGAAGTAVGARSRARTALKGLLGRGAPWAAEGELLCWGGASSNGVSWCGTLGGGESSGGTKDSEDC